MLRVTPLYGSAWSSSGAAQPPAATLVEYAGCRILWNVGGVASAAVGGGGLAASARTSALDRSSDHAKNPSSQPSAQHRSSLLLNKKQLLQHHQHQNAEDDDGTGNKPDSGLRPLMWPGEVDWPDHDCLIITDSSIQSLGALPTYHQSMILRSAASGSSSLTVSTKSPLGKASAKNTVQSSSSPPPIYATFPTVKMGQMTLYDQHAALSLDGKCPPYTLDQVDRVFFSVQSIKYAQAIAITPRHRDRSGLPSRMEEEDDDDHEQLEDSSRTVGRPTLTVTAHRAGHGVGGAFYVLQNLLDETVVVLTTTYNLAKELHLDSSTLLQYGRTPDVLVTYPGGPALPWLGALMQGPRPALPSLMVSQTERSLTEAIMAVLRRDGHVLLPTDAAGRVLELVLLLQQHWDRHRLQAAYHLIWLGPMVANTSEFVKSQLEWMSTQLGHEFDNMALGGGPRGGGGAHHPFQLPAFTMVSTYAELKSLLEDRPNPACVVATGLNLEGGPARDVLLAWADNADHAIIFTDSSQCYLRPSSTAAPTLEGRERTRPGDGTEDFAMQDDSMRGSAEPTAGAEPSASRDPSTTVTVIPERPDKVEETEKGGPAAAVPGEDDEEGGLMIVGQTVDKISEWTTAGQLLRAWALAKAQGREMDDTVIVDVPVPTRAPLTGTELRAFLAAEEAARLQQKAEAEQRAMLREVELAKGRLRLGEEHDTSTLSTGAASSNRGGAREGAGNAPSSSTRPRKKSRFDSTLFLKFSKPLNLTFEVREESVGLGQPDSVAKYGIGESVGRSGEVLEDDYGIAVQADLFTDIVSGVDPSKFSGGSGRIGDDVIRRGFGYGVDGRSTKPKKPTSAKDGSSAARVSEDEDQDTSDELGEDVLEAMDLSEGNGIIRGRNGRPPTKVTTVYRKLEVLAEISYINLEGRVDARAAKQSVRALQPRHVIVMGGTAPGPLPVMEGLRLTDEVVALADAARSFVAAGGLVCTPNSGETVELSVGHAAFPVRLIDAPFQSRQDREKEALEPIELYETKLGACTVSLVNYVATGQKVALDGSIVLAPKPESESDSPSLYLSDGEILLTDLRLELIGKGMKAEYSTHSGYSQLIINGKVVVKKVTESGRIEVEGPLCEDFNAVRAIVCGQYVIL